MKQLSSYATAAQVEAGFRPLSASETEKCAALIQEAGIMIDAAAPAAPADVKMLVTCRMVRRAIGAGEDGVPLGATQSTVSALGYSQTFGFGAGASSGELYLGKTEKSLLGLSDRIGASNPYGEGASCCTE